MAYPDKYKPVDGRPNIFNDPYNLGLLGGTTVGFVCSYIFGGKIYPFIRQAFSSLMIGQSKLALVVNSDLKMSKGKIASQCCHGAIIAHSKMLSPLTSYRSGKGLLTSWRTAGQPKIVLRAHTDAIIELEKVAKKHSIPVFRVHDAGRTQVPADSLTVLAVGPAPSNIITELTSHLRLL